MKHLFLKTAVLLFTLTFFNCENNDPQDQLPPITQTGENTFGAIVDGNVFIPKDKTGYSAPGGGRPRGLNISSGDGIISKNYYAISAVNYIDTDIYIYIPEDRPQQKEYIIQLSPGTTSISKTPDFPHIYCYINNRKYISFENSGSINFEVVDFTNQVCAGIFYAKLKNENDENDLIEITNGRFDFICTEPIGD